MKTSNKLLLSLVIGFAAAILANNLIVNTKYQKMNIRHHKVSNQQQGILQDKPKP